MKKLLPADWKFVEVLMAGFVLACGAKLADVVLGAALPLLATVARSVPAG